jgi:hypothetical protein
MKIKKKCKHPSYFWLQAKTQQKNLTFLLLKKDCQHQKIKRTHILAIGGGRG